MRLISFHTLTAFLASTLLTTSCARPTYTNTTLASATKAAELDTRAQPNLKVPLTLVALETWQGSRDYQSGPFRTTLSNEEVRESAKQTYASLTGRLPATLLVSVIYIPGAGLVAGTIWRAAPELFDGLAAQHAPNFWAAVPGPNQGLLAGAKNDNKWHAEAVAALMAESTYAGHMNGAKWPDGTKIATYGRKLGGHPGPVAACDALHTSVLISCDVWLRELDISIV